MDPSEQPDADVDFENDPSHILRALEEVGSAQRHTVTGDTAARKGTLSLTLEFFELLEQQIDHKWDPKEPVKRAPPPPLPGLPVNPSGVVDPAQIPDPELRAQYERELKEAADNVKHRSAQFELHRIDQSATERFKLFVKRCYSGSAADRREFEELLDASSLSDARKKSLRKLIKPRLWPF